MAARNGTGTRRGRSGYTWNRLRARVLREETHCWRCGEPVDVSLSGMVPAGPTVDHIVPLSQGGAAEDRANLRLAHRRCNLRAGDRRPELAAPTTTRDW